jgi:hypothetical protein
MLFAFELATYQVTLHFVCIFISVLDLLMESPPKWLKLLIHHTESKSA